MEEIICKPCIWWSTISKVLKIVKKSYNLIWKYVINQWRRDRMYRFFKEYIKVNRYVKKYWASLIRELQVKITMRYHLIPIRTAIIKKIGVTYFGKATEKREPLFKLCVCPVSSPVTLQVHPGHKWQNFLLFVFKGTIVLSLIPHFLYPLKET